MKFKRFIQSFHVELLIIFILTFFKSQEIFSHSIFPKSNIAFVSRNLDTTYKDQYRAVIPNKMYPDSILFGINGHPLTQEAYKNNDLDKQLDLIEELNLKSYRIDVLVDSTGKLHEESRWLKLLKKAQARKIKILPILLSSNWEEMKDTLSSFYFGNNVGASFSYKYRKYIKQYEIGNEEDIKVLLGETEGRKRSDYNLDKFKLLANYYLGLIQGIKSEDPTAEIIINSSGWLHFGFFELLAEEQVPYDIIGYHWYSNMGDMVKSDFNILDSLARFNKPIWITEVNRRNGSKQGKYTAHTQFEESKSEEVAQFQWLIRYIDQVNSHPFVKAFFIHELYDQPALDDKSGFDAPQDAYFGLVKWLKKYSRYKKKEGFILLSEKLNGLKVFQEGDKLK